MVKRLYLFDSWLEIIFGCFVMAGLFVVASFNYMLFHSLAELFSVVVAFAAFVLVAGASQRIQTPSIVILGVSFLCIGFFDLLHTLAYQGMGVFDRDDPNLATQLWIAARGSQALAFVAAGVFHRARINFALLFWCMVFVTGALTVLVFSRHFPVCFTVQSGLTPFKIYAEYCIAGLLLVAAGLLARLRRELGTVVVRLVTVGIVAGVMAELAFTQYASVYDAANLLGHFFKIVSFYFIYKAIVENGYARPQELLFSRLAASEANLRQAQRLVQMGSWEMNLGSGAAVWSEELFRILGYTPGTEPEPGFDLLRKHVHPDDWNTLRQALDTAADLGRSFDMELRYVPEGGKVRMAQLNCEVERGSRGLPARLFGAMRDVTLRRQAEQLRQDVERITRHDLKTPLNGIIYLTQFLEDTRLDEEQSQYVAEISQNAYTILSLINVSLGLYRMERGEYELDARTVDLIPVLQRVVRDLSEIQAAGHISLDILLDGNPLQPDGTFEVRGEELLCYTLMANLVRNALEAAPKGSTITVRLEHKPVCRFLVHNQGAVPVQVRDRFFDKDATFGKRHGTGLGTYSAKLIAEVHGWDIGLDTSLENGTTVWVEFPW